MNLSTTFRPVVLAPTYNNARMLYGVMSEIAAQGLPVMVVDDGCTDGTPEILRRWQNEQSDGPARHVVTHPVNRGKADALRTGFVAARELGYTHAITIDTDGQLDPTQIGDLLASAKESPTALILGARDETAPDYPAKSKTGRRVSNFAVWLQSGAHVLDSQCGFRVYPLDLVNALPSNGHRYGFETEILTRFAWAGAEIRHVTVSCIYDVPGGRISHLHPTKDTLRGIGMNLRLLARSCVSLAKRVDSPDHPVPTGTVLRRTLRLLDPVRAWREFRHESDGTAGFAE